MILWYNTILRAKEELVQSCGHHNSQEAGSAGKQHLEAHVLNSSGEVGKKQQEAVAPQKVATKVFNRFLAATSTNSDSLLPLLPLKPSSNCSKVSTCKWHLPKNIQWQLRDATR